MTPVPLSPLSIVLCTCNGAGYLDEQMWSLRIQEDVKEIIVVDDASTDDTWTILRRHALEDPRVGLHQNEVRLGVSRNFQRALGLAASPWIALADQDDIWLPHKLTRMRAGWDGRSQLIHHPSRKFRGNVPLPLRSGCAGEKRKFTGTDWRRLLYRNTVVGHTTVVSADLVGRLLPFPPDVPHDWWIGLGAAAYAAVQYVDEYLVHYRIHSGNAYHALGSRCRRLRAEHRMRLQLLRALAARPDWPGFGREFARDYLALLRAARPQGFSWPLWHFYWKNAGVLFGTVRWRPSGPTLWRKSLSAALGGMMHSFLPTVDEEATAASSPIATAAHGPSPETA